MGIKCRRPLLTLCGDVSRITLAMGECRKCPPEVISLRIEQVGCVELIEKCEEVVIAVGCFCGDPVEFTHTKIVQEEIPKTGVTYPLHELTTKGEAVFVLDSKFTDMGSGRYTGTVSFGECGNKVFDIEYNCGPTTIYSITAQNMEGC